MDKGNSFGSPNVRDVAFCILSFMKLHFISLEGYIPNGIMRQNNMNRVRESRIKLPLIQRARMTYVIDPNISIGGDPSRQSLSLSLHKMSFGNVVFFFSAMYFFHYLDFSKIARVTL